MANDYSKLSKEELLKVVEKLESRKKYGLIWDEERTKEQFERESENALPILKEVKGKEIKTNPSKPVNILIEGDNYHALSVLNYTHQGKVDVIYIDPPYNTGNKSWKYNNSFVERDDSFKHSKWLSFMSKRLRLAKGLLPDHGIIVVAIDDYEYHTLRLFMDELFGEDNRLGSIVVVHNPRGRNDDKHFATMHEYLLVYAKNSVFAQVGHFELTDDDIDQYNKNDDISAYNETSFMRTGNNSNRETRPNLFYPIYYYPKTNKLSLDKRREAIKLLPINEGGEEKTWRWGKETFEELCETELLVRNVKGKHRIFKKRRISNIQGKKPKTVWYDPRYDASTYGIMVLQNIFQKKDVFPYPKSLYSTQDILRLVSKKDSIILDFFAGSGTTAHAILDLNKDDDGFRQFIICTNDEGNICSEVCYPRVSKVMLGYKNKKNKSINGLSSNLKYFKTSFVRRSISKDSLKVRITRECTEMLCLREGVFEEVKKTDDFSIFEHNDRIMGVYYSLERAELKSLKKDLNKMKGKKILYCFTLDPLGLDKKDFRDWKGVSLEPIPQKILDIYEGICEY
jgi:adenine-specific DNA-methyltransferase